MGCDLVKGHMVGEHVGKDQLGTSQRQETTSQSHN